MNASKYCHVCGDQATGFNYNGQTCDSCKMFFMRNFSKIEKLQCITKQHNCPIDIATRKCCPKCRLEKCLSVGMKSKFEIVNIDDGNKKCVNLNKFFDFKICNEFYRVDEVLIKSRQNNHELINRTFVRLKRYAIDLTSYERKQIDHIQSAISVITDEYSVQMVGFTSEFGDNFHISNFYMKKTIEFCHKITAFQHMNSQDQFTVLKSFCFEILAIRFAFLFDLSRNGFPKIWDEDGKQAIFVNLDSVQQKMKNQDLVKIDLDFYVRLKDEMENDMTIRNLLTTILLFNTRRKVSCPEYIRYQHFLYWHLLQRYLEHKYKNVQQANRKLCTLTKLIHQLDQIKEYERMMITEQNILDLPGMIAEIYSLI